MERQANSDPVPQGFRVYVLLAYKLPANDQLNALFHWRRPAYHASSICFAEFVLEQETSAGSEAGNNRY